MSRFLLIVAALVPVAVLGATLDLDRFAGAVVVEDPSGYNSITLHDPVLNTANNWEDDLLTLAHAHPTETSMQVHASIIQGTERFQIEPENATLVSGQEQPLRIRATQQDVGDYPVTIRLEVDFYAEGLVGDSTVERTLQVVIE